MKKFYFTIALAWAVSSCFAQLTVTTNPSSASVCAGNSVSITASAVPVSYTTSAIANNPYDPFNYSTTVLVDQLNSTVAPLSTGSLDDGRWDNITLPFSFRFYGNVFNSINISTNGWIGMGSTNTTSTGLGVTLPNASAPNNVIHAITSDLTFAGTSNPAVLQYFEDGTSPNRKFIIDYSNLTFFSASGTANVQVILYETTNVIEIHTTNCSNTSLPKAQGIENGTGTVASVSTGRNNTTNWTGTPNAFRFTPDNITYTWSPATGLNTTSGATVIATPANTTTYTVNALNPSNGHTGSTTVTVTINAASYVLAGTAGGPQICQNISVSPSGTSYRDGTCNLIAGITPAGGSPVSNSINSCVQVDTGANKKGTTNLYVARKYDIEPLLNPYPATSTANVTLYYLQSEFDNFNTKASDSNQKALPTGPADAAGISNLVLKQFHGTGTNPLNYTGPSEDFTTATSGFTVIWNATRSWWEVTVPVTAFSGFYISSKPIGTLATSLNYFKGIQADNKNILTWKATCTSAQVTFKIERSIDAVHYFAIANIQASQARCSLPFEITDDNPAAGVNYYRLTTIDADGRVSLSNIVTLTNKTKGFDIVSISPNPVANENAMLKINAGENCQVNIIVSDFAGRIIQNSKAQLITGINQVSINTKLLLPGIYLVSVNTNTYKPKTTRLVKQ